MLLKFVYSQGNFNPESHDQMIMTHKLKGITVSDAVNSGYYEVMTFFPRQP